MLDDAGIRFLTPYAAGLLAYLIGRARGLPSSAFWALVLVAIGQMGIGIARSFERVLDTGSVLLPLTTVQLSSFYISKLVPRLGLLVLAIWLLAPRGGIHQAATRLAREARMPNVGERRSLMWGFLLLIPLAIVGLIFESILYGIPDLVTGNEAGYFQFMEPIHALLLGLAAGFQEELLYRVALQGLLLRITRNVWVASGIQCILFALAHSGYGTVAHLLLPFGFAVVATVLYYKLGLWCVTILHAGVNTLGFLREPGFASLGSILILLAMLVGLAWALREGWQVRRERMSAQSEI